MKHHALAFILRHYPDQDVVQYLAHGFQHGFSLEYSGERNKIICPNLQSAINKPDQVTKKLKDLVEKGFFAGPFEDCPIPNLRCNPIGLVPKSSKNEWRLIQHLSYPPGQGVNQYIDKKHTSVQYESFSFAASRITTMEDPWMTKVDIKQAFFNMIIRPEDFCLLGVFWQQNYYLCKVLPMGCAIACTL